MQPSAAGFRPEIHGLRGVAILLVVAYHLWTAGRVSGGVDVFLFISAFLMTASFVRKGTAFRLLDFLVQRFRRLVPLAAIVVAATTAIGWVVLPPTRYEGLLNHARASLIYRENWRLIADEANYMVADPQRLNPFQHFWSLSLQGQLFVLLPLVFVAAAALERHRGIPIRRTLAVVLGLATVASFAWAVHRVEVDPAAAYFETWARAWEFTAAGLVALLPTLRMPAALARALSWAGVALLLATGLLWGRGAFPAWAALPPLAAAALVILSGPRSDDAGHAAWWLSRRPVTFVANRAYSLYLWHWPVYVFTVVLTSNGDPRTGPVDSLTILALSFVLADLSTRLVERRFHRLDLLRSKRYAATAILAFTLMATSVLGGVAALVEADDRATAALPPDQRPGARALTPGPDAAVTTAPALPTAPSPTPGRGIAPGDRAIALDWPQDLPPCKEGVPGHPARPDLGWCGVLEPEGTPTRVVAVVGDSHAFQWLTTLIPMAEDRGWRLAAYGRAACRVGSPRPDPGCTEYTDEAIAWLLETRPDQVISTGSSTRADGAEHDDWGWAEAIAPVAHAGIAVVNVRDNPRWDFDMPECVQRYGTDDPRCSARRADKLAEAWPTGGLADLPNQYYLDFSDWFCPPTKVSICPGVIGNTYVYMDSNHLSRAYLESMGDVFAQAWDEAMG
ncbi:acyltransferase family protein [Propioniciclava sinopodophylli]|uniref:acyltransferase family protein n=1 Tax=Propioniciclava sinopodophylli TaxID=1837344 RepID=UPI002490E399|nr:acyltransferase family protein [Propioniciclava sinopodophylli]